MPSTQTYRNTHIMTASPMELIIMLYDQCVSSLEKAEQAFDIEGPERYQEISNNILHAQDIITELSVSLNMEQGGQIAANLQQLYEFMISHLSEANANKERNGIRDTKIMMRDLGNTWKEVATKADQNSPGLPTEGQIKIEG